MIMLYGIPNCDTVKKARAWLTAHGAAYIFHDFKKQGLPEPELDTWLQSAGWQTVINRKGTSWRTLDAATQAGVSSAATARAVALAQPSVIKRPVALWGDGTLTVGFTPERYASYLQQHLHPHPHAHRP